MYSKMLIAPDRSFGTEAVLNIAADLARVKGSVIRLLHVAPRPTAVMADGRVIAYADQESERLRYEAQVSLRQAVSSVDGPPGRSPSRVHVFQSLGNPLKGE